jgi:hypothetical protein
MTHDEIIGVLRKQGSVRLRSEPFDAEIADRLDRYRELLLRARIVVPPAFLKHIEEALK